MQKKRSGLQRNQIFNQGTEKYRQIHTSYALLREKSRLMKCNI